MTVVVFRPYQHVNNGNGQLCFLKKTASTQSDIFFY